MRTEKIQREMFTALLQHPEKCISAKISKTETMFTFDGCRAFVMENKKIKFNVDATINKGELLNIAKDNPSDVLMEITNDLRLLGDNSSIARKIVCSNPEDTIAGEDGERTNQVWANHKFLDYFLFPEFYANDINGRILVKERNKLCAMILPMKIR